MMLNTFSCAYWLLLYISLGRFLLKLPPFGGASLVGSDSKESACNVGDSGSIPGQEDPLEEGMATHSSILVWRIQWTEERGGQSMGLQRIGHD